MRQLCYLRMRLIFALSMMLACLLPQTPWALSLKPGDGIRAPVSLSGHLAVFYDSSGALTIDDVVSGRPDVRFTPIPSMLTQGYRKGAVWVRFSLSAPADSGPWLLQIERPLIEQATLYISDGAGHFAVSPPGYIDPWNKRDARAYPALFPILGTTAEREYYFRLQSSTSITSALNVWSKDGFEQYIRNGNWLIGILIGAIGAMIIANLLYALWLRDPIYPLYAVLLFISGLISIFHMGYASEILHFLKPQQIHRSWGAIVCLYSVVMALFLGQLFEFRRHSIWAWRIIQVIALLNGIALIFALIGRYGDVGLFVSGLQQLFFIYIASVVLYLLIVRRQYQYLLSAIAFGSVVVVLLVMQLQYTGANPLRIDSSLARVLAVGTLIHTVLLSAAVAKRAQLAERSLSEEKDRAIAVSRLAERELAIRVRERTAELAESNASLEEEVDRRYHLETKLRQSLDSVNDALAQQRDFLALVTHEFRGPLAVIATAVDNLALSAAESSDDVQVRAAKIRRTVNRMSMLIENVLAGDRLDAAGKPLAVVETFDLNEILRVEQAALDDDAIRRVTFIPGDEARVRGDRYLLEIALQNLIQNALKYSAATDPVAVRLSMDQGMALVSVIDRGAGVPPEEQAFIFLKYYRSAGQRVKGSGLGLYISREIARQHGGELIIAASDVNGSTFRFSLPLTEPGPMPVDPVMG